MLNFKRRTRKRGEDNILGREKRTRTKAQKWRADSEKSG